MSIFVLRDRYHEVAGPLHGIDARVKILVTVAFAFAVSSVPEGRWLAFGGFALFVLVAVLLSRLPIGLVIKRSLLALPFVAAAVPLIFTRPGETVFTVPLVNWTASTAGLTAVASIVTKSWLAVVVATVMTACTTPVDLIRGLERLRVPRLLAAIVFLMYRYLFVIGDEGQRLMRAREARSAATDGRRSGGSIGWRGRVLGNMVGSLFIRSYERSERIYAAMLARGYDGSTRAAEERVLWRSDWSLLLVALAALGTLVLYAHL